LRLNGRPVSIPTRRASDPGRPSRALERPDAGETRVERHHRQEREQNLDAGDGHAELPGHLFEVTVQSLDSRLVATGLGVWSVRVSHGLLHLHQMAFTTTRRAPA